jgi:DNA-binding response OmpR family regulator
MAKVLLVEDDNNLREIYEARLQAEGYETATASDGEQALVVAKEAKPDLVISDVMMPKISGFEMLDILRNTDGLKDVKVIMLTALGQSEDKARADQLGADKYLVKSQVTLEDIVKTAHQLLDEPADSSAAAPAAAAAAAPEPATTSQPSDDTGTVAAATTAQETQVMQAQIDSFAGQPAAPAADPPAAASTDDAATVHDDKVMAEAVQSLNGDTEAQKPSDVTAVEIAPPAASEAPAAAEEASPAAEEKDDDDDNDGVTVNHKKIIKPLSDSLDKPDLNQLLAKEEAAQIIDTAAADPTVSLPPPAEAPVDPTLQVSPELQAAMDEGQATSTPSSPAELATPVNVQEPKADPDQPNPNDIAL